ncbi:hypothetical protein ABH899_005778, partial [Paenibacillus sp. RC84]
YAHEPGDLVTYKGVQYTVVSPQEREYRDVNQYVLKKVVANDPI